MYFCGRQCRWSGVWFHCAIMQCVCQWHALKSLLCVDFTQAHTCNADTYAHLLDCVSNHIVTCTNYMCTHCACEYTPHTHLHTHKLAQA